MDKVEMLDGGSNHVHQHEDHVVISIPAEEIYSDAPEDTPESKLDENHSHDAQNMKYSLFLCFSNAANMVFEKPLIEAVINVRGGFDEIKEKINGKKITSQYQGTYVIFVSGKPAAFPEVGTFARERNTSTWASFARAFCTERDVAENKLMADNLLMNIGLFVNEPQVKVFNMTTFSEAFVMGQFRHLEEDASLQGENEKLIACAIISGKIKNKFKPQCKGGVDKVISNVTKVVSPIPGAVILSMSTKDAKEYFRDAGHNNIRIAVLAIEDVAMVSLLAGWYFHHKIPKLSTFFQVCGQLLCIAGVFLLQAPLFE